MPTDSLTIAIRFALYANLMVLFGWPLFAYYGPSEAIARFCPPRLLLIGLALSALALSLLSITAMTATMAGVSLGNVDRSSVSAMIFETPMGAAWCVRMAALALLIVMSAAVPPARSVSYFALVAGSGIALATLAWTGHGAAGEGAAGWLQLSGDVIHLLAAGAWVGALVALARIVGRRSAAYTAADVAIAHRALDGFAVAGSIIVGLLVVTGLVSGWILVGPDHVFNLLITEYGRLLAIKLALFTVMIGLAASNRFRLTPALGRQLAADASPRAAFAALRRSIVIEMILAAGVLAAVAWLGTLAPPMAS